LDAYQVGDRRLSGTTLKKPENQRTATKAECCLVCGEKLKGRAKLYCGKVCRKEGLAAKVAQARKTAQKPLKTPPPVMDTRAPVEREKHPLHQKAPAIPRSAITYGAVYEGTMLMRRKEGGHFVAPVYVGVDTLSLVDRLHRVFKDADRLKLGAVIVDGVLYPKLFNKELQAEAWYVWKRPRDVYELTLREMGLSDNEIFFRMSVQRLESAKSELRVAFGFMPMPPEAWHQYLKWQKMFLEDARKRQDAEREKRVQWRISALTEAMSARDQWLHWSKLVTQKN
jgi:hypothetical protein